MPSENKIIKITLIETGGEFTGGIVSDKKTIQVIKEKIEEGEMSSNFDYGDGENFDACSINDFFGIYGPQVPGSNVLIEESVDDKEFKEIFDGSIEDSGIRIFESSNPYPGDLISEDQLLVYTYKYEKRINCEFKINTPKSAEFDFKDIYLGYMLMDETIFTEDEILEHIIYIPKNEVSQYIKEYEEISGFNYEEEDQQQLMDDLIGEIFSDYPDLAKKIIDNHSINYDNCEGKGEWENDYIKVVDSSEEILFENGQY